MVELEGAQEGRLRRVMKKGDEISPLVIEAATLPVIEVATHSFRS